MNNTNKILLVLGFLFFISILLRLFKRESFNIGDIKNNILSSDSTGAVVAMPDYLTDLQTQINTIRNQLSTTSGGAGVASSIIVTDSTGAKKNLSFPRGLIMVWHNNRTTNPTSSDLPLGWSLCDGGTYNGYTTPDLRGRFILGAGSGSNLTARTVGVVGGTENHSLTIDEMPSHNHNSGGDTFFSLPSVSNTWAAKAIGKTNTNLSNAGGNKPHNNMPPFYVLCYICYTGQGL